MIWLAFGFFSPLLITAFMLFVRSKLPPGSRSPRFSNARRLWLEAAVGVFILGAFFLMVLSCAAIQRTYDSDPACRQSLELAQSASGGLCRVDDATLSADWWIGRRLTPRYLIYAHGIDGFRSSAEIAMGTDGMQVWNVVRKHPGITGRIQIFRGLIVKIDVAGTSGDTYDMESVKESQAVQWMAVGAGFIFAALLELVLAPLILRPGW